MSRMGAVDGSVFLTARTGVNSMTKIWVSQ